MLAREAANVFADQFEATANDMIAAVRQQQLEGVIGKRKDSLYEPGKRTGSWVKCRVNCGQELVIGGYIPGPSGFDSLIVGYYRGKDLMYVARVRNGFVPASRRQVLEKIRHLVSPVMPFVNLPDEHPSRWGENLTAEKMSEIGSEYRQYVQNFIRANGTSTCSACPIVRRTATVLGN